MFSRFFARIIIALFITGIFSQYLLLGQIPNYNTPYIISTLAGNAISGPGYQNGTGTGASFYQPYGIVADTSGNVYVADGGNCVVRKITSSGVVSTIAGTPGVSGSSDGNGTAALFGFLSGIAIDSSGNLYVTDKTYNTVRKLSPNGSSWIASTIVPPGAGLNQPIGLAIDSQNNIFVDDTSNCVIRKISPSGNLSVFAGTLGKVGATNAVGTSASFSSPTGIAIDNANNLYVTDCGANTIRMITPSGVVTTLGGYLGSPGFLDGPLNNTTGQFDHPFGIAVSSAGNIAISDASGTIIRQISTLSTVSSLAGKLGISGRSDGTGSAASFYNVTGITFDSSGNIFMADMGASTIRKGYLASAVLPPVITSSLSATGTTNSTFSYQVVASNSPTSYTATALPAGLSINNTSGLISGMPTSAGTASIILTASNSGGSSSSTLTLTVSSTIISPPVITSPLSATGTTNSTFSYQVVASNSPTSYTATALPAGLSINNTSGLISGMPTSAGTASIILTASNSGGSSSSTLTLTVSSTIISPPVITVQPINQNVNLGFSTALYVTVISSDTTQTYQWYLNGEAIAGATSSSFTIPSATSANEGLYTVIITNNSGSVTSKPALLTVLNPGRLTNLSVLSLDGPGSQLLTIGFVSGGLNTTGSQNLLIRASGPTIGASPFNVPNVLTDPTLTVFNSSTVAVSTNDNWGTPASNANAVIAANAATGAFALTATTSLDAAVVTSLKAGSYTVQVAGKNGVSGNVIAEVYDNTPTNSYTIATPRLLNLSCLEQVSAGGILSAGFVIGGNTSEQVLIRVSGPTLAGAPFNLTGTIPDPKVTIFNSSSAILATNSGWGGNAAITAANSAAGAFQFANGTSKDSAVLITLLPGAYTVQATSVSGTAGITLIEVYEVTTK